MTQPLEPDPAAIANLPPGVRDTYRRAVERYYGLPLSTIHARAIDHALIDAQQALGGSISVQAVIAAVRLQRSNGKIRAEDAPQLGPLLDALLASPLLTDGPAPVRSTARRVRPRRTGVES